MTYVNHHAVPFMDRDFLLTTPTARHLYHDVAASLPIIDYHCHLSPEMIARDHQFANITELWLGGDHYKWRAMRANGVEERFITGDASDRDKFMMWAETVPYTMRNPLYHWTHMELRSAFGIEDILSPDTAADIYDRCNEQLRRPDMTARGLMRKYGVEVVCTTDDPVDSLEYHLQIAADPTFDIKVLPTWRPDKAMTISSGTDHADYLAYLRKLSEVSGVEIRSLADLYAALRVRHDFFHEAGCRLADHGVTRFPFAHVTTEEASTLFDSVLRGEPLTAHEAEQLTTAIFLELCRMNHASDWAQQFHFGPMRNVNTRARLSLGPDTGFDTIGDFRAAESIAAFLDTLDRDDTLARTILYNLNPADNTWVAAMLANFQDGRIPGKIQMGSGWWFNDQLDGMRHQMEALSLQGLLSRFVGMLTDSRSFLSYPRHDYFRRLLCEIIGRDVDSGMLPVSEMPRIERMVSDICHDNAARYFRF
ncbi:MAG: glucuronate isomerase [Muribaculaceae bacterium]|nr:glucuronate isomerase [Muribaculaceae bacterium]